MVSRPGPAGAEAYARAADRDRDTHPWTLARILRLWTQAAATARAAPETGGRRRARGLPVKSCDHAESVKLFSCEFSLVVATLRKKNLGRIKYF